MTLRIVILAAMSASFGFGQKLMLMPMPQKVVMGQGALPVDSGFRALAADGAPDRLKRGVARMVANLARQTGLPLQNATSGPAALLVECDEHSDTPDRLGQDESYTLDVTLRQAKLRSKTIAGSLRGLQTFLQLVSASDNGFAAPAVHIEDKPRFPWRGFLLDVTSHWMPVSVIERNLDAMEAVKLNVFHWHLTDDQGFRVESEVFPKLHELGSDGDYYTRDDIRHILAYAHDRGIRVVPEIDMPGHCASWLVGYPELASIPGKYSIIHTFGIYDPTIDPTRDDVYEFVDKLIGEVAALFPDEYFHIGGDEVNGKQWKSSPAIQKFIRENGLRDEAGLQAYFNRRVEVLVKKHGKKMMGWDEILHPNLPRDVLLHSWRDQESMVTAVKSGHQGILSFGYYLDHLDSAAKHYSVDPLGGPAKSLTAEEAARVLGGAVCMWTEYASPDTVDSRNWPRGAAVAERLWSPADLTDVNSMYVRSEVVSRELDWRGLRNSINYVPMLERLAESAPAEIPLDALKTLADVVEPLGIDGREGNYRYNQSTPLNRLVDAARPESAMVREMELQIENLARGRKTNPAIRKTLAGWKENDNLLREGISHSFLLRETMPLSADLSAAGALGLQALDFIEAGTQPPAAWKEQSLASLKKYEQPQAEVILAASRPVRKLVLLAAGN